MSSLLLPPSPNWFLPDTLSANEESKTFVTASFKNIVVYENEPSTNKWNAARQIYFSQGRVNALCFYPFEECDTYNKDVVAAVGDNGALLLVNSKTGKFLAQHTVKNTNFKSCAWAKVDDEICIIAVGHGGEKGVLARWTPKYKAARVFNTYEKDLSLVSVIPHCPCEALVVSEKVILHASLKDGSVIKAKDDTKFRVFKGHKTLIYDLSWHTGGLNPLTINDEMVRSSSDATGDRIKCPRFFATTDFAKNLFIWDFEKGECIMKLEVPQSLKKEKKTFEKFKDPNKDKIHIALLWIDNTLYCGTPKGDLIQWNLRENNSSFLLVDQISKRVVYNFATIGNIIIATSHDREIVGFDLDKQRGCFHISCIGVRPVTMAFSPVSDDRMAIGHVDGSVKLFQITGKEIEKTSTTSISTKSKISALAWHPCEEQENCLLIGTSQGEVSILDILTKKLTTFSNYHGRDVYKVEWGPPLKSFGYDDKYLVYSFGDQQVLARSPSDVNKQPLNMRSVFKDLLMDKTNVIIEFSFSPDYKYIAFGFNEGLIQIFDVNTTKLKVTIDSIRKIIQHLCWKPFNNDQKYVLAVGSAECNIHVFNLDMLKGLDDEDEDISVTKSDVVLRGHKSRVIWLSWSLHSDGLLSSASYDHTVMVWDTHIGKPICCFGGHSQRVFRAEFSPSEPDLVFSFAEENSFHAWRPSEVKTVLPKEALAPGKERHLSSGRVRSPSPSRKENGIENDGSSTNYDPETNSQIETYKPKLVKSGCKSNFPVLQTTFTKKRSFLQACLLVLIKEASIKELQKESPENSEVKSFMKQNKNDKLTEVVNNYLCFFNEPQTITVADTSIFIDFFGNLAQFDNAILREINVHEENGNIHARDLMHCWRGSIEEHIRSCALQNKLNPFLIAVSPQNPQKLWKTAVEAYVLQLVDEGDFVTASAYLLALDKVDDAIDLLLKHRHYREAYTVSRCANAFDNTQTERVVCEWGLAAVSDGSLELAVGAYICMGKYESAARVLSRRQEILSLVMASELYDLGNIPEQSENALFQALRDGLERQEFQKVRDIMKKHSKCKWFESLLHGHEILVQLESKINLPIDEDDNIVEYDECLIIPSLLDMYKRAEIDIYNDNYLEKIKSHFPNQDFVAFQSNKTFLLLLSVTASMIIFSNSVAKYNTWKTCIENVFCNILYLDNKEQAYKAVRFFVGKDFDGKTLLMAPDSDDPYAKALSMLLPFTELDLFMKIFSRRDNKEKFVEYMDKLEKRLESFDLKDIQNVYGVDELVNKRAALLEEYRKAKSDMAKSN